MNTIPENATKAGKMEGDVALDQRRLDQILDTVLGQWQYAVNVKHYEIEGYTHPADQVHGHYGAKYARLDIGGSGAFMIDMIFGDIYGIAGYGKVDKKKVSGNIYNPTFHGGTLLVTRFRYGRFDLRTKTEVR